jgi:hypothetical protein
LWFARIEELSNLLSDAATAEALPDDDATSLVSLDR